MNKNSLRTLLCLSIITCLLNSPGVLAAGPNIPAIPNAISAALLVQQTYLKASNTQTGDFFGNALALSGNTLVVGANYEDSGASTVNGDQSDNSKDASGAAYVFVRSGLSWVQQAYLKASNPDNGSWFGIDVAISGDTIVVGAENESGAAYTCVQCGAAHVFVRSGTVWSEQAILTAYYPDGYDSFGHTVAIDGDTIVVGAHQEDSAANVVNGSESDDSAAESGAAFVFTRDGTTWSQQAYLKPTNTGAGDQFGFAVAISGDTVAVSAWDEASCAKDVGGDQANNACADAGAAYVFTRTDTEWSQQAYIKASNTEALDNFGASLDLSGETLVISSLEDSNATGVNGDQLDNSATLAGAAYVYTRSAGLWSQQAYLKASNTERFDYFGGAVAIDGDQLVITATNEDSSATGVNGNQADNTVFDSGAVYLFKRSGSTWSQLYYIKASNPNMIDNFGSSADIAGGILAVGATWESSNAVGIDGNQLDNSAVQAGAAYVFAPPFLYIPLISGGAAVPPP